MQFGISSACFYPQLTEKAVRFLCENGVQNIEIFFNSACEAKGKIFKEIKSIIKENGTNVTSIHPFTSAFEPFMLFSDYVRRFTDGLEFCKLYFEAAAALGTQIIVLHGDRADRLGHDDRYIERYQKLYELGRQNGVYIAQENVSRCRSRDLEFLKKMKRELGDSVRFVLDLKQSRRSGVDYKDIVSSLGEKIVHLHLNDFDENHDCLLAGQGMCDFKEVFSLIEEKTNCQNAIIEVYRNNYGDYSELIESLNFVKNLN